MKERKIGALIVSLMFAASAHHLFAQPDQSSTPVVGYVLISNGSGTSVAVPDLAVSQTFDFRQGDFEQQTELPAPQMTTSALLSVSISNSLGSDTGIAITNPNPVAALITMTLLRSDGTIAAVITIPIPGRQQISRLVTQLFSDTTEITREFTGTVDLKSNIPVAVIAVRLGGLSFSSEPLSQLSAPTPIPQVIPGAGGSSGPLFILPNFVTGGGWTTKIVLINTSSAPTAVRLDFFSADGSPLSLTLNGVSGSTFTGFTIPARGILVISPQN